MAVQFFYDFKIIMGITKDNILAIGQGGK